MIKPITIDGVHYDFQADDAYLDTFTHQYEPQMVKFFKAIVPENSVTLDIGANLGCTAVLLSKLSRHVHAFEPVDITFRFLKQNVSRFGNISAYRVAIGDATKPVQMVVNPSNRSGSFVAGFSPPPPGTITEPAHMASVDSLILELGIPKVDFIKIDVEGAELCVLRGATQTLKFKPLVVLELCTWTLNSQQVSVSEYFSSLRFIFPIVLAVYTPESIYYDLHDPRQAHAAMAEHILKGRFDSILAGFSEDQFSNFRTLYRHL